MLSHLASAPSPNHAAVHWFTLGSMPSLTEKASAYSPKNVLCKPTRDLTIPDINLDLPNPISDSGPHPLSHTKHVWYSEHGTYYQFEFILERAMSATHIAVILRTRTSPAYEEEFMKMDYPDVRNEYGTS